MSDADALSAGVDSFSTTTRSLLVQRLRDEILSGGMPHGTRLRQVEVAARFGISPTPVREAFRELATLGLVLLSRIPTDGTYLADLFPGLMTMSIGMGLTFVPVTLLATTNVPGGDAGLASGLFNTSQQIGGALGLAILSTLAATRTSHKIDGLGHKASFTERATATISGYHLAFALGAGLMALAVVLLATLIRKRDVEQIQTEEPMALAA